jgi:hypothetical protein
VAALPAATDYSNATKDPGVFTAPWFCAKPLILQ